MKRIYLFFIIFIFYSLIFCQTNQWQSWQYDKNILSIAAQGRFIWLGSNIKGLIRMDTITNEKIFYNTSNSPLPSNCVSFIKIDYNGNIWTNAGGLTCFDGINWTIFTHNNSNLPECNIVEFDFDHSGNIWAATDIGLVKFDGVTSTVYDSSNSGLPYDSYYQNRKNCVSVDSSGKVWVSNVSVLNWSITSYYNGLWQTYNMTQLGLYDNFIPVYCLEIDFYDTLWIGTGYGGLVHKVGDEIFIYNNSNSGIPGNWVSCIDFDLDGNIWMGSWDDYIYCGGVAKFDGNNWQTWITGYGGGGTWVDFYMLNCIETQAERVWVGTQRGFDEYDGSYWYHNSLSDNGLTNYCIEPVVVDQNNRVWLGCQGSTVGQGLIMFDGNYWSYFDCVVNGLCVDHYNRVWELDSRNCVKRFDITNGSVTIVDLPSEYNPNVPQNLVGMAFESDDSFWLAANFFIAKLTHGGLWTVYTSENSGLLVDPEYGAPMIIGIYIDRHDNKWIFNGNQGLIMFNGYDWIYYNESTTGLPIKKVVSVLVDLEDNLWIAEGHDKRLYKFDGTNWTEYNANNSLIPGGSYLYCLNMDTQGKIWLGTSEGLFIIDGDNWQIFNTANSGLPNNDVRSIAFDSFGNAWLGTLDGLAVYYTNTLNNDDYMSNHFNAEFLLSNYPNPFNPETNISFILPTTGYVKLNIYNIKGQKVISLFQGNLAEGKHNFSFNIADSKENKISSGVYFIKLEFENDIQIHKILLIK